MASGVNVSDNVKCFFHEMKVPKSTEDRIRLATFEFSNDCIEVDKVYTQKDFDDDKDVFDTFMELLSPQKCRYIVYDCHFATKETSTKEELVYVMWCPDDGPAKERMRYASSEGALTKCFCGVKHRMQLNDRSDCLDRFAFAEKLGRNLISIEGKYLSHQHADNHNDNH